MDLEILAYLITVLSKSRKLRSLITSKIIQAIIFIKRDFRKINKISHSKNKLDLIVKELK